MYPCRCQSWALLAILPAQVPLLFQLPIFGCQVTTQTQGIWVYVIIQNLPSIPAHDSPCASHCLPHPHCTTSSSVPEERSLSSFCMRSSIQALMTDTALWDDNLRAGLFMRCNKSLLFADGVYTAGGRVQPEAVSTSQKRKNG